MIMHIAIVTLMAVMLFLLMRKRLIQIELIFPWFVVIVILAILSLNPTFVDWLGAQLNILYPPIAVVFIVIFLVLALIIVISIGLTRIHKRQVLIVRQMAAAALEAQERLLGQDSGPQAENEEKDLLV